MSDIIVVVSIRDQFGLAMLKSIPSQFLNNCIFIYQKLELKEISNYCDTSKYAHYQSITTELNKELNKCNGSKKILINLWGSIVFNSDFLEHFDYTINIHPGLLPSQAGNHTATWTIRNKKSAGSSILTISKKLDGGYIYTEASLWPHDQNENAQMRQDRLKNQMLELIKNQFSRIITTISSWETYLPANGEYKNYKSKYTELDRIKNIEEIVSDDGFIAWANSHTFFNSWPCVRINNTQYMVRSKINIGNASNYRQEVRRTVNDLNKAIIEGGKEIHLILRSNNCETIYYLIPGRKVTG